MQQPEKESTNNDNPYLHMDEFLNNPEPPKQDLIAEVGNNKTNFFLILFLILFSGLLLIAAYFFIDVRNAQEDTIVKNESLSDINENVASKFGSYINSDNSSVNDSSTLVQESTTTNLINKTQGAYNNKSYKIQTVKNSASLNTYYIQDGVLVREEKPQSYGQFNIFIYTADKSIKALYEDKQLYFSTRVFDSRNTIDGWAQLFKVLENLNSLHLQQEGIFALIQDNDSYTIIVNSETGLIEKITTENATYSYKYDLIRNINDYIVLSSDYIEVDKSTRIPVNQNDVAKYDNRMNPIIVR